VTIGDSPVLRANGFGARWNPERLEALYTSLEKNVALAEVRYLIGREPLPIHKPLVPHELIVKLHRVVDLSTDEALDKAELSRSMVIADDHSVPQLIGGAVARLGIPGLLVPSARADGTNLVVFVTKREPNDVVEVVSAHS
jgi:RES domain-containing protein